MKYSYELMDKAVKHPWGAQRFLFQEHRVPVATYYRWLKKYRSGHGSVHAQMDQRLDQLKKQANNIIKENMRTYKDHVDALILVNTDVDLDKLLENTKAKFEVKML